MANTLNSMQPRNKPTAAVYMHLMDTFACAKSMNVNSTRLLSAHFFQHWHCKQFKTYTHTFRFSMVHAELPMNILFWFCMFSMWTNLSSGWHTVRALGSSAWHNASDRENSFHWHAHVQCVDREVFQVNLFIQSKSEWGVSVSAGGDFISFTTIDGFLQLFTA